MAGYEKEIQELVGLVRDSDNIVFFGGAGVSTESQIPDFRSTDGLYHQEYNFPPETILSHTFFMRHTEEFYRFYQNKMLFLEAQPNPAHLALTKLEEQGRLKAVITQNIDGLHQAAGSQNVQELHGSVLRNYCMKCHTFYDAYYMKQADGVPKCQHCGGIIKPDVVLYEEGLNDRIIDASIRAIREADVLIVGGTSMIVYPAAGLIDYYRGNKLVLINRDATARDDRADLIIREPIGQVFTKVMENL